MSTNSSDMKDILGIGIGPFNLSLAALLSPHRSLSYAFFDKSPTFAWHPGMLFPDSKIQASHLKDLVTPVDPTNPYSFISYLVKNKRLYRFINSNFNSLSRMEFNAYFNWASRLLPGLHFAEEVEEAAFEGSYFLLRTAKRLLKGKHLVLGSGLNARIPDCAKPHLGKKIFHNKSFLERALDYRGLRVVVIGGGQSGAEIVNYLLSDSSRLPAQLTWVSRRYQFLAMDNSPFTDELFSPAYSRYFFHLPAANKAALLREQIIPSDGVAESLLETIYQRLYTLNYLENQANCFQLLPKHELTAIHAEGNHYELSLFDHYASLERHIEADIIILCTGYLWELPAYLAPLTPILPLKNGKLHINADFSVNWDGPAANKIFIQNGARHTHGIGDPNLTLMAWRSAAIINSIASTAIYDIDQEDTVANWENLLPRHNQWSNVSNA